MRNSIKLLATVSTLLSANVFAAGAEQGTADVDKSYKLAFQHNLTTRGFKYDQLDGGFVGAPADAVSVRCSMIADCGRGDEYTYEVLKRITSSFKEQMKAIFPEVGIEEHHGMATTLFEDQDVIKWNPDKIHDTAALLTGILYPFQGDLYDVALMVNLLEKGQPKQIVFLPESHGQKYSINNLREQQIEAYPISALKELVPSNGHEGRQILKSSLAIRVGTHEYINMMVRNFDGYLFKGTGYRIVRTPWVNPSFNVIQLLTMQTGPWLHPKNAESIEQALNKARGTLRGDDGTQLLKIDFRGLEVDSVDSVKPDGTTKRIISGEFTR
jgi:hypothetical protein